MTNEGTIANSTYKKLAVQWLNEPLCFVSRFVLRNRQLLVSAKRQVVKKPNFNIYLQKTMLRFP